MTNPEPELPPTVAAWLRLAEAPVSDGVRRAVLRAVAATPQRRRRTAWGGLTGVPRRIAATASVVATVLVLVAVTTAIMPATNGVPGPVSPLSAYPAVVPFCTDVPDLVVPDDRFGDSPIYVGNEQPTDALRRWARQQPGFQDLWIDRDHLGWVVLAFSQDADVRQADLEREFPGVGAVAIDVDWTTKDLESLQQRGSVMSGVVALTATDIRKGVVILGIGVLDPAKVAELRREFAGRRVCIDAIDPATVPAPGPQPQSGEGWRLLGDAKVGAPYRTGIAADRAVFEALWTKAGMTEPAPAVDFDTEVAIWFGAVYGSSCPGIRMDDVVVDTDAALVHALIVQADPQVACTADANGHAYLVALDRDRLPAPPFRIQLQEEDPPPGAIEQVTVVEDDLRAPGSVPGPGAVHPVDSPADERPSFVVSGGTVEPGFPDDYLLRMDCGAEWLGQLNGVWWRTDVPPGTTRFIPEGWADDEEGVSGLGVVVLMRTADDPANPDGQPRVEVTRNGVTVIYRPSTEAPPACPDAPS